MELDEGFRPVVERSFNSLSVDTDTSTSDTAAVLASGVAGPVDPHAFILALQAVCIGPHPAAGLRRRGRDQAAGGRR